MVSAAYCYCWLWLLPALLLPLLGGAPGGQALLI